MSERQKPQQGRVDRTLSFAARHKLSLVALPLVSIAVDQLASEDYKVAAFNGGSAVVLFGADVARNAFEKKYNEFKFSDNPGINILEDYLGIKFDRKPQKVEWTKRNKRILYKRLDHSIATASDEAMISGSSGISIPELGIILTRKDSDVIIDAHESMHQFIQQIMPQIERGELSDNEVKKFITIRCFVEGVATYASYIAAIAHYHELVRTGKPAESILNVIVDRMDDDLFSITDAPQGGKHIEFASLKEKDSEELLQIKELYESALSLDLSDSSRIEEYRNLFKRGTNLRVNLQYRVGINFVSNAISRIADSVEDFSMRDALVTLIQNPPSTFEELTQPEDYVDQKILGEQKLQ